MLVYSLVYNFSRSFRNLYLLSIEDQKTIQLQFCQDKNCPRKFTTTFLCILNIFSQLRLFPIFYIIIYVLGVYASLTPDWILWTFNQHVSHYFIVVTEPVETGQDRYKYCCLREKVQFLINKRDIFLCFSYKEILLLDSVIRANSELFYTATASS